MSSHSVYGPTSDLLEIFELSQNWLSHELTETQNAGSVTNLEFNVNLIIVFFWRSAKSNNVL